MLVDVYKKFIVEVHNIGCVAVGPYFEWHSGI
jgi:hypothetical protein